jgi:transcriptional regulator EpsA
VEDFISETETIVGSKTGTSANLSAPSKLPTPLQERRRADFFDVIGSSLTINNPEDFREWAKSDLQFVLPHGMLICGIGLIENQNAQIKQLLTSNFSPEYIETLQQAGGMGSSPIIRQWLKTRQPVLFELAAQQIQTTWLDNFKLHGLQNVAAHGLCDLNSKTTSYFSFSRIPGKLNTRHTSLLNMLVPHLHVALIRALSGAKKESRKPKLALPELTGREHQILNWLSKGKTNLEIAQALFLSEHTVKNHVQRILVKLKVNTRAQAVVKVLERTKEPKFAA